MQKLQSKSSRVDGSRAVADLAGLVVAAFWLHRRAYPEKAEKVSATGKIMQAIWPDGKLIMLADSGALPRCQLASV